MLKCKALHKLQVKQMIQMKQVKQMKQMKQVKQVKQMKQMIQMIQMNSSMHKCGGFYSYPSIDIRSSFPALWFLIEIGYISYLKFNPETQI